MFLTKKFNTTIALILFCFLLAACGPSPEELATTAAAETAAAATSTPTITPSPTPTPTPTPVPYDLSVSVLGLEDTPLVGAVVILAEVMDEEGTEITDESGQVFWIDLPGDSVNFSISSQGYLPQDTSVLIDRGPNQFSITLERDPFGMLPSEACSTGENLIYIEDFQDGKAQGWNEIEYAAQGWSIIPHPDTPEDIVTRHAGDQSAGAFLEDSILENAVWRVWLMVTGRGGFFLNFDFAEPTTIEGGDWSAYQLYYQYEYFQTLLIRYVAPNDWTQPGLRSQRINENTWVKYEVSYYEGRVEVWVDDVLWFAYQDPNPLPSGKVGFEVRQDSNEDFRIYFDDISICELTGPFVPKPTPAQ